MITDEQFQKLEQEFKDHRHLGTDTQKVRSGDVEGSSVVVARAYLSTNQAVTSSPTDIAFDAESYNVGDIVLALIPFSYTISTPGKYEIHVVAHLQDIADNETMNAFILKNGGITSRARAHIAGGTAECSSQAFDILDLVAGDVMTAQVAFSNPATAIGGSTYTYITIKKL